MMSESIYRKSILILLAAAIWLVPNLACSQSDSDCRHTVTKGCLFNISDDGALDHRKLQQSIDALRFLGCNGDSSAAFILWQAYQLGNDGISKDLALAERWRLQENRLLAKGGQTRSPNVPGIIGNLSPEQLPKIPDDPELCATVIKFDLKQLDTSKTTEDRETRPGGKQYIEDLVGLIERSDQIVVTEHSDPTDFPGHGHDDSRVPNELVYRSRYLSNDERINFAQTIESLDSFTQAIFLMCLPKIHHTIRFYSNKELISKMGICFECNQVEWSGTSATPPASLYDGLAKFMKAIGLSPDRDWQKIAERSLAGLSIDS